MFDILKFYDTGKVADRLEGRYFDFDFLKLKENEVFINCGAAGGGTIKEFADFSNNTYNKIYGFEPMAPSIENTKKFLQKEKLKRVVIVNSGVWSKTTDLYFSPLGGGYANEHAMSEDDNKLPVTTIDETVGNDKVTFIEMDIEGSELEALKGAEKTIIRCKPRLAICIYHKPEDILTIPLYLHSIVPEYIFFIRNTDLVQISHTLLYAMLEEDINI